MYCTECNCEFTGWRDRCPVCRSVLLENKPAFQPNEANPLTYETLVEQVTESGGELQIDLFATDVEMKRSHEFPYMGRGYAWAKRMQGNCDDCQVDLTTTETGRDREWSFPYFGYGLAWEKKMEGTIGGNELILRATDVEREKKYKFPYLGFGRAWVKKMAGRCGKQLAVELVVTDVEKRRNWSFPYFGFGYAWASKGTLILKLAS